jgi:Ser/Thr protein kinase RdoA (MazF antagonist)
VDTFDLPDAADKWLLIQLGDFQVGHTYRERGARTGVWRVAAGDGKYIFKLHNSRLRWHSEVMAYQQWVTAYAPYVAQLYAVYSDDKTQGILLSALPGRPLVECQLETQALEEVYRQAGEFCRKLADFAGGTRFGLTAPDGTPVGFHGQENDEELSDPVKYIRHALLATYDKAQRLAALQPTELALAKWALDSLESFAGEKPLLVNLDYTPGNWLVDGDGRFTGVIDLEHISWDVEVAAFTRLESTYFPEFPRAKQAFYEGYGADLSEKSEQLRILRIMHALYNVAFGTDAGDQVRLERGRAILRRLDIG